IGNIPVVIEAIREKKSPYTFIEVMSCPGGCLGGGGQPIPRNMSKIKKRQQGIYEVDRGKKLRCSHENLSVQQLYTEFLEHPGSHKSHQYLHTHYHSRKKGELK
ncbi:MAG TPA: ferredoxin, partial [Spirochaetia bacterium]|nr:ferredoxin [Spirochaetia bacterium]